MRRIAVSYLFFMLCLGHSWIETEEPSTPPQSPANPSPQSLARASDHPFDLLNVALDLTLDDANQSIRGTAVNSLIPLKDGLDTITFHCGQNLIVSACAIDGKESVFRHNGDSLSIAASPP